MAKSARLSALVCLLLLAGGSPAWAAKKKTAAKAPHPAPAASPEARTGPVAAALRLPVPEIPPEMTELPLTAKGAIVLDACTGETLYALNAEEAQYPASTTKIMTALLVIENGDLDHFVEVTDEDSKVGESSLNIRPGDRFTRREGLYGLMLKSANDVAHALGRDNAGTAAAFAEKMTIRAQELGAVNTHFANPNGLHHPQHYTSPHDLALIARAAMQQPFFRQVVSTQYHPWQSPASGLVELRNHNHLLWGFPGCTGVKTGYTNPAQQVLVTAAQWGTREVIAAVMHDGKPGVWDDSKLLLTFGLERPPAAPNDGPRLRLTKAAKRMVCSVDLRVRAV